MDNADLPVSLVDAFAEKAKEVGAYKASQAANQTTALKLVLDQARKLNPKVHQMKVGELLSKVDSILDQYGGQTKASPASITAYKWRAKRLLTDFIERNEGDFYAWKTELARKSAAARVGKRSKVKVAAPVAPPPLPPVKEEISVSGQKSYELRLAGRSGRLILPDPISQKEIDLVWKQLGAYKTLLETMVDTSEEAGVSQ
jgi:hypothetical protein